MNFPSKVVSCLAVLVALSRVPNAEAAVAPPPRDLTFPAAAEGTHSSIRRDVSVSQIGSSNEATAEPGVPHPNETPCVSVVFYKAQFADYAPHTFTYTPPKNCPGPYNKIIFGANFAVTPGIQFDRTASIEIGNVPIYFGTTAEPSPNLGPTWKVQRDITDDAALLGTKQTVEADIFNIVNSTYTGVISGTMYIEFYPANGAAIPATKSPDVVLPFPGVTGGPQHLNTGSSTLTATYTLPTNTESAFMDVYAQSQQTDEQYFLCAPNDVASELYTCGNGPLRETEISIDGTPAGMAPVYPWIFTGGLDPYLWVPIPGVQTLEFKPYRVNLTPFASLFANGKPHTITLSVDNADNYFQGFGTLFAYEDHGSRTVTGAVTTNTFVANPAPEVAENISSSTLDGTIAVNSRRQYETAGYVNTSAGKVTTEVVSALSFTNNQRYSNESDFTGTTAVDQYTTAKSIERVTSPAGVQMNERETSFPVAVSLALVLDDTGTGTQVAKIAQNYTEQTLRHGTFYNDASIESNTVDTTDTLDILDDEYITGNANQASSQTYHFADASTCITTFLAAANNVVTQATNKRCPTGTAALRALMQSFPR